MGADQDHIAYLKRRAEECLARAASASSDAARAQWIDLANLWLALIPPGKSESD